MQQRGAFPPLQLSPGFTDLVEVLIVPVGFLGLLGNELVLAVHCLERLVLEGDLARTTPPLCSLVADLAHGAHGPPEVGGRPDFSEGLEVLIAGAGRTL